MPEILTPAVEQTDFDISLYPTIGNIQDKRLEALTLLTATGPQTYTSESGFVKKKIKFLTSFLTYDENDQDPKTPEFQHIIEGKSLLSEIVLQEVAEEMFGDEFVVRLTPSSLDTSIPLTDTHRGVITDEPVKKRSNGGDVILLRRSQTEDGEVLVPYLLLDAKLGTAVASTCPFNTQLNIASIPITIRDFQWFNKRTGENIGFHGYASFMKNMILHKAYRQLWKLDEEIRKQWMRETAEQLYCGLNFCGTLLVLQQEAYGVEEGDDEILHRLSILKKATARHLHLN